MRFDGDSKGNQVHALILLAIGARGDVITELHDIRARAPVILPAKIDFLGRELLAKAIEARSGSEVGGNSRPAPISEGDKMLGPKRTLATFGRLIKRRSEPKL